MFPICVNSTLFTDKSQSAKAHATADGVIPLYYGPSGLYEPITVY
jgi:hypothetical protein